MVSTHSIRKWNDGFTYMTMLAFVVISGIALTGVSKYWSTVTAREREKELLFRGEQIGKAIETYYESAPEGMPKEYPQELEGLLRDPRFATVRRHLRKIYRDPMTKDGAWNIVYTAEGRIKGVYSKSNRRPFKVSDFPPGYESFEKSKSYLDWKFVYYPATKK